MLTVCFVQYDQTYDPQFMEDPNHAAGAASTPTVPQPETPEKTRGRKRTRTQVDLVLIMTVLCFIYLLIISLGSPRCAGCKLGGEQESTSTVAYPTYARY